MRLVNLTPHIVRIQQTPQHPRIDIEPTHPAARVSVQHEIVALMCEDNLPIYRTVYGNVVGLPPPKNGVGYIVSQMVAQAAACRADLFAPATGHPGVVRVDGLIYSVPGLVSQAPEASHV